MARQTPCAHLRDQTRSAACDEPRDKAAFWISSPLPKWQAGARPSYFRMIPPPIRGGSTSIATRAVGVGVSAGGLAAIQQFLARAPAASGLAYVVVQHLDPTHKAMLVELLARSMAMPVFEAAETMRLEPDVV